MKKLRILWGILKRTRADHILLGFVLSIYTIFVVAIVTGVVVNFYTQLVEMQQKETLAMFMDKLERLPELSKEELEHISQKVRKFR